MQAGRLRHRVTLQTPGTPTKNSVGEDLPAWDTVATLWAAIEAVGGREFVASGGIRTEGTHLITIRYRTGVTPAMRIVWGSRTFAVEAARDPDGRRWTLELQCSERPVVGATA